MQIVINIPDGYVGVVMRNQKIDGSAMDKLLRQAVIDGTPLPKGHGRLIDSDKLLDSDGIIADSRKCHYIPMIDVYQASTIIEADKGSEK